MEVTLKTEVESGASGFSVTGGGNEGIFVKQVLKGSPASKIFSLREGDQLLSATIFFDNIKYEDALKILQYSEPYKVQFSLKRKLAGKEELEKIHSTAQHKKEKIKIKTLTPTKKDKIRKEDISMETPEILTVQYSTSSAYETKAGDIQDNVKKDLKDMENGLPIYTKKYPEVEINIKKQKKQLAISKPTTTTSQIPPITTQISKPTSEIQTPGFKDTQSKQIPQALPRTRKKKQKSSSEQKPTKVSLQHPGEEITNKEMRDHLEHTSVQIKGLEIKTTTKETGKTKQEKEINEEYEQDQTQISDLQENFEIYTKKGKQPETPKVDISFPSVDVSLPKTEVDIKGPEATTKVEKKEGEIKATDKDAKGKESKFKMPKFSMPLFGWSTTKETNDGVADVEEHLKEPQVTMPSVRAEGEITVSGPAIQAPSVELEIGTSAGKDGEKGKIKMPDVKLPSVKLPKVKAPQVQVSLPKVEADISLPKSQAKLEEGGLEVKVPDMESSIEVETGKTEATGMKIHMPKVKMPSMGFSKPEIKPPKVDMDVTLPKVDVTLPTKGKASGLEGKSQMPKFEKPKFGVSLPKGKVPESEISLPKMEADIPKPKVKGQLADTQAPKVDITLPSVDVSLPKTEVDIKGPEATAKAVKIEGEIKATDKDAKAKESKFKMPKFSMPSFGWSTSKETSGGVADVDASLKEHHVTIPSARAEGEITVSGPAIQAPSVELEIGTSAGKDGEKGKIKMPDAKLPSVKLSKVKGSQVQVSLPKVEADITLPKSQAEIKEGGIEVKVPDMESSMEVETGKAEATGMKIHMPKVKMPSMGFSKPEIKAPKVDVDVTLPKVDVTLPTCDVSLQEADLKADSVPRDVKISAPGVKIPKMEGSINLKGAGIEAKEPSVEIAVEGPEGKAAGLEGKIQMPKFEKPKFGVSLPKGKVPEGEISLPKMEADIPKPKVKGQVGSIGVETPTLAVEADVPDVETEASGWKIQMPSLKMPKMPKADIQAPKVDITLPSVDVSLPKAEVDIKGPEATAKAVKIEGEIKATDKDAKAKESKFKMPKFSMPSFGWSTSKETTGGVADVEASLKEHPVAIPSARAEGEITVSGPAIQAPSVELEIGTSAGKDGEKGKIKMPDVKLPSIKLPKVKAPQVQVSLPKVEADISLPKSQAEIKEGGFEVKVPDMESSIEVETGKAEGSYIISILSSFLPLTSGETFLQTEVLNKGLNDPSKLWMCSRGTFKPANSPVLLRT
uniref:PDZ domain-containing protein n=1 Tax=Chrysemys picta bellii TaxID=8478 RepID=A0A8C3I6M7_CHRPI